ncbi:MAG: hypothetical protein AAF919_06670 [Pseudomonadota bacterium]
MIFASLIRTAIALLTFATPALAQYVETCVDMHRESADLFTGLEAEGWTRIERSADVADRLLWITAISYLGGDSGAETLSSIVETQRKAVVNFDRLKALSTSETRVYGDRDGLLIAAWQQPLDGFASVQCRVSVSGLDLPPLDARFGAYIGTDISADAGQLLQATFQYNRDEILAVMPNALPPDLVIDIRHQYQIEDPE